MNDSLFDGEGIEASDLLALHALQQRERALTLQREQIELQREQIKRVGSTVAKTPIETPAKEVESGQCPHCGGALPDNASSKKFEYCMH